MEFKYSAKTDVGKKRDHNEDSYGVNHLEKLFMVCDGMGGHAAGDYASKKAVETILDSVSGGLEEAVVLPGPENVPSRARQLVSMALLANRRLFRLAMEYPKLRGMGTTFAAVQLEEGYASIVNVGDSRVYRLRGGQLKQLSVDHSWVEELLQDGELAHEELDTFREKNVITRALGTNPEIKADWLACDTEANDIFLICSDGLCGEVSDPVIQGVLAQYQDNIEAGTAALVDAANSAGGSDNTTVILIKIIDPGVKTETGIVMDEIITLGTDPEIMARIDSYIDKRYHPVKTDVPKGVEREKKKFYQNPLITAVILGSLLIGAAVLYKKPWETRPGAQTSNITRGDILVRTQPPGAVVSLYSGDTVVAQKTSPADFLSLEEGSYAVELSKPGFESQTVSVVVEKGRQQIVEVPLEVQAQIHLVAGMNDSGFSPDDEVYVDGELWEYYGQPLTVRRIGMVGKKINIDRGKEHIIAVGEVSRKIIVGENQDKVNVVLRNGEITVE